MRRLIIVILIAIASVLCAGAAFAAEYTVKKGDTLSGIAFKFTGKAANYSSLAKTNGIRDPNKIHVGQKLVIPDGVSLSEALAVKSRVKAVSTIPAKNERYSQNGAKTEDVFYYRYPGRNPYDGTLEKALELLGYPEEVKNALQDEVSRERFSLVDLKHGDRIAAMTFGKMKVKRNVIAAWKNPSHAYPAKLYQVESDGKVYKLLFPIVCGNWSRLEEFPVPSGITEIPPPEVVEVQEHFPEPSEVAETKYVQEMPEEQKPCCPIEHEPIIGAGVWGNGVANGSFEYAEYMMWLKKPVFNCDSPYAYGLGAYGSWEQGESDISTYRWRGHTVGPQIGLKYSGLYFDDDDKKYRLEQSTTKLRLVWEDTHGRNTQGYKMHQDSLKLGLYSEYVKELSDKWTGMAVAEGWLGLDSSIKSTWSGDKPSDRGQIMLAGYAQYKINEDWSARFGGGPFYQEWDDMSGIHLRAEARYKNFIMFGPYANLFPFGKSDAYKGIATHDLNGIGAFVRVEFGEPIRQYDRHRRMERVKLQDDERFGFIQEPIKPPEI